jgi:hypothetical protein
MMRPISVAALALLGTACTSVKSSDLATMGMSAHMTVTADSPGSTTASASLNVDDNVTDYVDLSSGDSLVATAAGGPSQAMSRSNVLGIISYSASFTGQGAPGTAYTIAFKRQAPAVSALSSTCTLPEVFQLTAPSAGAAFSRASDDIVVTYSGSGQPDPITYEVTGSCVNTVTGNVPGDSGTVTLAKGSLTQSSSSSSSGGGSSSCTATLKLRRSRKGQLDPAYGYGGSISCDQVRTLSFTSTP